MSQARIDDLCDSVVAAIEDYWSPTGANEVSAEFGPDVGLTEDDENTLIEGRKVYVFGGAYEIAGLVDRGIYDKRYSLSALVVERYTDAAGTPPNAWMRVRTLFVEGLLKLLRDQDLVLLGSIIPDIENGSKVETVYDFDVFQEHRAFWSHLTLNFQEAAPL